MIKFSNYLLISNIFKQNIVKNGIPLTITKKNVNTVPDKILSNARKSKLGNSVEKFEKDNPIKSESEQKSNYVQANRDFKFIYPDFLPNPVYYFRDKLREKLEREDMIERRKQINIPEFYVGSIMAVNVSDPYAPGKTNRFVGICIRRDGHQLRHTFTLRNTIDGLGVEIQYDLYNPSIQSIEVLRLEKRLDENLTYLQDCAPEYSTFNFDLQPVKLPPGMTVPLNTIKVPLNKKPWRHRWDRKALKGVIYPETKRYEYEQIIRSQSDHKPYEKYDMMKHYRENIHDDDQEEIIKDIKKFESEIENKKEVIISSKKFTKTRNIPDELLNNH